jgi:hypothetical protein
VRFFWRSWRAASIKGPLAIGRLPHEGPSPFVTFISQAGFIFDQLEHSHLPTLAGLGQVAAENKQSKEKSRSFLRENASDQSAQAIRNDRRSREPVCVLSVAPLASATNGSALLVDGGTVRSII